MVGARCDVNLPSGIPDHRDIQILQYIQHIQPKTRAWIGKPMLVFWIVKSTVDTPAHVLCETRINSGVNVIDNSCWVNMDGRR